MDLPIGPVYRPENLFVPMHSGAVRTGEKELVSAMFVRLNNFLAATPVVYGMERMLHAHMFFKICGHQVAKEETQWLRSFLSVFKGYFCKKMFLQ